MDIGQTVVIADCACVAVEAMEGTDEAVCASCADGGGKPLVVVKVSKPGQDMRFDVPVIGLPSIEHMSSAGVTALAVDAGRTLLFDRAKLIALADEKGIAIQAFLPPGVTPSSVDSARAEPKGGNKGMNQRMSAAPERFAVAVVGAGEFGRNHARVYRELQDTELLGIFDHRCWQKRARWPKNFNTRAFGDLDDLRGCVVAAALRFLHKRIAKLAAD